MLPDAIDVIGILVLVLPGFLAYRFVLQRRVDPTQRSPLWEVSEIVEHSVFVHIGGIFISAIVVWILALIGINTHAQEIFQNRPHDFLGKYFAEGVLWITLYSAYVIVSSSIIGAYDTPSKVLSGIIQLVSVSTTWIHKRKFLKWVPVPKYAYPAEPIWYYAFNPSPDDSEQNAPTGDYKRKTITVIVALKSGGVYVGEIASYSIVSDTQSEKDFLIRRASYYKDGNLHIDDNTLDMLDKDIDAVLLNTSNVDSIRIYYDESDP